MQSRITRATLNAITTRPSVSIARFQDPTWIRASSTELGQTHDPVGSAPHASTHPHSGAANLKTMWDTGENASNMESQRRRKSSGIRPKPKRTNLAGTGKTFEGISSSTARNSLENDTTSAESGPSIGISMEEYTDHLFNAIGDESNSRFKQPLGRKTGLSLQQYISYLYRKQAPTKGTFQVRESGGNSASKENTAHSSTVAPIRYVADKDSHPKAATLAEARDLFYKHSPLELSALPTTGQPYSLPRPQDYLGKTKTRLRHLYDRMTYKTMPTAKWYADAAVKPLLLTFDAFGTLFTPREPIETQYCEAARQYSLSLNESDVKDSFAKAYKAQLKAHPNYGKRTGLDPERWWTEVIEQTIIKLLPEEQNIPRHLASDLYTRFSSSEGYRMYDDVFDLLTLIGTSFQAANWPPRRTMLGIISNSDPRVYSILESFGIEVYPSLFPPRWAPESIAQRPNFGPAHFAFASLSYVHGVGKPSTELYGSALRDAQRALDGLHQVGRLTRSGNAILENINRDFYHMHIGDDWDKDIVPAMQQGFEAVLIDRSLKEKVSYRWCEGRVVSVVNSLAEIRQLLTEERMREPQRHTLERPVPLQARPYGNTHGRRLKSHPGFPEGEFVTLA